MTRNECSTVMAWRGRPPCKALVQLNYIKVRNYAKLPFIVLVFIRADAIQQLRCHPERGAKDPTQ